MGDSYDDAMPPSEFGAFDGGALYTTCGLLDVSDGTPAGTKALLSMPALNDYLEDGRYQPHFVTTHASAPAVTRTFFLEPAGTVYLSEYDGQTVTRITSVELTQAPAVDEPPWWVPDVSMATAGDLLLFAKEDPPYGRELWRTDGTPGQTALVADVFSGSEGSQPDSITALGPEGPFVFSACDPDHGCEPWLTWGSADTTTRLADLVPGPGSSQPRDFRLAGDRLFFSADDGVHGREPWVMDASDLLKPKLGITCPMDVRATSPNRFLVVLDLPKARGIGPVAVGPEYSPRLDAPLMLGKTTITAWVEDAQGQTASCSFDVDVAPAPAQASLLPQVSIRPPLAEPRLAPTPDLAGGCACDATSAVSGWVLALGAMALRRRRRRS